MKKMILILALISTFIACEKDAIYISEDTCMTCYGTLTVNEYCGNALTIALNNGMHCEE